MILSICIPTYNRSTMLQQAVNAIFASIQKTDHFSEIEVIISDNKSSDDTPEIVKHLQLKYPSIIASRNIENVADENFFIAASLARGKYLWVLADDDLIEENAITCLLDLFKKDPSLIILNYSFWNINFSKKIKDERYSFKTNMNILEYNILLEKFSMGLQFISGIIIKKELFFSYRPFDYKLLHEYGSSFMYAVYNGIQKECNVFYLNAPLLLKYRSFNATIVATNVWYKYFVFGNNYFLEVLGKQGYSKYSIRKARNKIVNDYLLRDLFNRKFSENDFYHLNRLIPRVYFKNLRVLLTFVFLLLIPKFIFNVGYRIIKKV